MVVGSERQANKDTDKGWVFLRHPSIFTLDMAGVLLYSQPCMGLRRKERSNLGKAKTKASGGQPLPPSHLYLFALVKDTYLRFYPNFKKEKRESYWVYGTTTVNID